MIANIQENNIGHIRRGLQFDGVNDYVEVENSENLNYSNITIIIYTKELDCGVGKYRNIISKSNDDDVEWWIQVRSDGNIEFGTDTINGNEYTILPNVNGNKFIVGVLTNLSISLYINNRHISTSIDKRMVYDYSVKIAKVRSNEYDFNGNIYFVAIYNRALSDDEISQMYDYVEKGKGSMITDGLVLWLDGDSIDEANGVWKDKSGNGNDGVIYGAKVIGNEDYKVERDYLNFDGLNDYVEITDDESLDVQNQTIIIYMKHVYTSNWQCYFNHGIHGVWLGTADGYDNLYAIIGDGSSWKIANKYIISWKGNNMIIAKIYIDSNNTYGDIYLNTNRLQSKSVSKFNIGYGSNPIRIGNQFYSNTYMVLGDVYFVALYNRALSDDEIKQIYDYVVKGEGNMITDGLVLWLDDDSIGDDGVWYDKSGNDNNGQINGAKKISRFGGD